MEEVSKKITGTIEISSALFSKTEKEVKNIASFKRKIEDSLSKRVTDILQILFGGAIPLEASDIHVEPKENQVRLRIRVDGLLQDVVIFDLETYQRLLARIKLLSGIKLNITNRPQDGRFSILINKTSIEIRVSILPAEYGESIVLRILHPKSLIELKSLGLRESLLEILKKEIRKPNGMIIVTGPTGSGKTTTLYALLKRIQKPEIKIITIEDPIEYHLKGISQTQVNPKKGYDFASGLKSIMRQDPDVILVGEIRDLETVKTALQAALTGHLVLTTLHTNDAAGTVARLVSLGAKVENIGPAINVAIAQRLIRKVCKKCSRLEKISPQNLEKLKKSLRGIPKEIQIPKLKKDLKVPKVVGCIDCNSTGFKGRIGIFEIFSVDEEMEKFILKNPSISALREMATKKGMLTMHQEGLIKVLEGITTIEEVERVTGE